MQERKYAGQEGCRTGRMQDRRGTGQGGFRTGVMQESRDSGKVLVGCSDSVSFNNNSYPDKLFLATTNYSCPPHTPVKISLPSYT